jgi:hypothetical protein
MSIHIHHCRFYRLAQSDASLLSLPASAFIKSLFQLPEQSDRDQSARRYVLLRSNPCVLRRVASLLRARIPLFTRPALIRNVPAPFGLTEFYLRLVVPWNRNGYRRFSEEHWLRDSIAETLPDLRSMQNNVNRGHDEAESFRIGCRPVKLLCGSLILFADHPRNGQRRSHRRSLIFLSLFSARMNPSSGRSVHLPMSGRENRPKSTSFSFTPMEARHSRTIFSSGIGTHRADIPPHRRA